MAAEHNVRRLSKSLTRVQILGVFQDLLVMVALTKALNITT
jgi:hypothetical protein